MKSETLLSGGVIGGMFAVLVGVEMFCSHAHHGQHQAEPNATTLHVCRMLEDTGAKWERGSTMNTIGVYGDEFDRDWRLLIEFDDDGRCVRLEMAGENIRREFAGFEMAMVHAAYAKRLPSVQQIGGAP